MKKITITFFILIISISVLLFWRNISKKAGVASPSTNQSAQQTGNAAEPVKPVEVFPIDSAFQSPLDRAQERVTKKPFGILINPKTSPVQPEKFSGYHTGTDFEIFPEELDVDVAVKAVCSGKLLVKRYATGYGGVAVQSCELDDNLITVIYGHLKLVSIALNVGDSISAGETIGILGKAYSQETNGERKHLHLGFHKETEINILGYVPNKKDLSNWINPCLYVCGN